VVDVLPRVVKELAHAAVVARHAAAVARGGGAVLGHGLHLETRHAHHLLDGVPAGSDVMGCQRRTSAGGESRGPDVEVIEYQKDSPFGCMGIDCTSPAGQRGCRDDVSC
jgi:hypothetical protein